MPKKPREPFIPSKLPWTPEEEARYTSTLLNSGTATRVRPAKPRDETFVLPTGEISAQELARMRGVLNRSSARILGRQRMQEESERTGHMREDKAREFFGNHYEGVVAEVATKNAFFDVAKEMDEGRLERSPENVAALVGGFQHWLDSRGPSYIIPPGDLNFDAI